MSSMRDVLGARKPLVALRVTQEHNIPRVEILAASPEAISKLQGIKEFVEGRFRAGKELLNPEKWDRLLSCSKPSPDDRWSSLVRLATKPTEAQAKWRDRFVALPDGTAFSMRLLLLDRRGGSRRSEAPSCDLAGQIDFARIPDVVKLRCWEDALLAYGELAWTDTKFARQLQAVLENREIPATLTHRHISRLREKLDNHARRQSGGRPGRRAD